MQWLGFLPCNNELDLRSNARVLSFGDNVWRDIGSFPIDPMYLNSAYQTCDVGVYFESTINFQYHSRHYHPNLEL